MVVIENNSALDRSLCHCWTTTRNRGYRLLMERTIKPLIKSRKRATFQGEWRWFHDKNPMEALGYARAMADVLMKMYTMWLSSGRSGTARPLPAMEDVRNGEDGEWHQIRRRFRYLTQRPWTRLPIQSKTLIPQPHHCLPGWGRNKMLTSSLRYIQCRVGRQRLEIITQKPSGMSARRSSDLGTQTGG